MDFISNSYSNPACYPYFRKFLISNPLPKNPKGGILLQRRVMENENILYHFDNKYLDEPLRFNEIQLIQIGRRYCGGGDIVQPHMHGKWFELTIVTGGSGTVLTNDIECEINANDIYLSFPYEFHEIRADRDGGLKYDYFSFYCKESNIADDLEQIRISHIGNVNRIFHDEKISLLIRNALHEFRADDSYKSEILESIFRQILIYTIRDAHDIKQSSLDLSDANLLCYKVMNYIDTHIYTLRKLTEVSEDFSYNYDYLANLFRKTTNQKLSDYFIDRKLEMARLLLLENKKKITEIADIANYANVFAFSKAFKNKYGISPLKYKQQHLPS